MRKKKKTKVLQDPAPHAWTEVVFFGLRAVGPGANGPNAFWEDMKT